VKDAHRLSLPRSEAVTLSYARAGAVFVSTAVLWCSAAALVMVAILIRVPDSDTGSRASMATAVWLVVAAIALLLSSGPVAFAIARQRWLLALPLFGVALALVSFGLASLG
jgi:hypothetical protein